MSERFPDEVLLKAFDKAEVAAGNGNRIRLDPQRIDAAIVAAMRAVLEGHLAAHAPTPEQVALHEQYVVDHASDHEDACPADDTCWCDMKPRNDAVNAICRYLSTGVASDGSPR